MSRYALLVILVLPIAIYNILSSLVDYKTKTVSKRGAWLMSMLWVCIVVGLALSEEIYNFLFTRKLTETEPMSLFDVVAITAIIILTSAVIRLRAEFNNQNHKQTKIIEAMAVIRKPKSNS